MNTCKTTRSRTLPRALVAAALTTLASAGCAPTSHAVAPSALGVPRGSAELERVVAVPGPVEVETVVAADWEISRAGLINLDHPRAKAAGLTDAPEPIQIVFHALRHPQRGTYLVDTGIERALWADPEHAAIDTTTGAFMGIDRMKIRIDTASWLARQRQPVAGVLLTHLHADHVAGLRDLPSGTPVFAGPGETSESSLLNLFVAPVVDRALDGKGPLSELGFARDPDGRFEGVLDLFGDRTVWAIHVPGHTPGSTAYLARTPSGPVLLVGDASHTAWGWQHGVEPGTFSSDGPRSADSLRRLRELVARHPQISVRLGHQPLPTAAPVASPNQTASRVAADGR